MRKRGFMKKETEENLKMIWSIFAIIGIFSTLIFVYELFDKDENTSVCIEYELKIDNLENEIEDLRSELSVEEDTNRELESNLEACKEEYDLLEESKGCASSGKSEHKLTDGSASN